MAQTSRRRPEDVARLVQPEDFAARRSAEESPKPRPLRSKRGIDPETTSQLCFRLEKERHRKLRVHCASEGIEIGEFMDKLLREAGF